METGSSSVQSLSLSDSHLAELDGDTLRLFGLGALEALERGWGVQTAAAVTVITFRYISFDAIVPTLPRIRVKFPNLLVIWAVWDNVLDVSVFPFALDVLLHFSMFGVRENTDVTDFQVPSWVMMIARAVIFEIQTWLYVLCIFIFIYSSLLSWQQPMLQDTLIYLNASQKTIAHRMHKQKWILWFFFHFTLDQI